MSELFDRYISALSHVYSLEAMIGEDYERNSRYYKNQTYEKAVERMSDKRTAECQLHICNSQNPYELQSLLYCPMPEIMIQNGYILDHVYFFGTLEKHVGRPIVFETQHWHANTETASESIYSIFRSLEPGEYISVKTNALVGYHTRTCIAYLWRQDLESYAKQMNIPVEQAYEHKGTIDTCPRFGLVVGTNDLKSQKIAREKMFYKKPV